MIDPDHELSISRQAKILEISHPGHKVFAYLLRHRTIAQPNEVWALDITYIPMARGVVYFVGVMDWATRRILSWQLSTTLTADFCVEALEDAIRRYACPEIVNTDQGSQFTSAAFVDSVSERFLERMAVLP